MQLRAQPWIYPDTEIGPGEIRERCDVTSSNAQDVLTFVHPDKNLALSACIDTAGAVYIEGKNVAIFGSILADKLQIVASEQIYNLGYLRGTAARTLDAPKVSTVLEGGHYPPFLSFLDKSVVTHVQTTLTDVKCRRLYGLS